MGKTGYEKNKYGNCFSRVHHWGELRKRTIDKGKLIARKVISERG